MPEEEKTENPVLNAEHWKIIYEHSPLGIELYDDEGRLIDANPACLEIFGVRDVSEVSGFNLFSDPNLSEEHLDELRRGGTVKQEIAFDFDKVREHNLYRTTKEGTIYLDMAITPLRPQEMQANIGYIVHVRDITLRRNAEAMLLEQKRFVEEVIEKSAVAAFVLDRDHKVVLWNRACEELTGVPAERMIGTSDHWKPFYPEERLTLADIILDNRQELVLHLYTKSSPSTLIPDGIRGEGWYGNLNGKDRYIAFDAAPLRDTQNRLVGAIETLHDLTDARRTEEDLERRTQELVRSNEELENFAHTASHDLKAPLLSISGFADVLEEKYGDRLDEKGRSFLSRIIEGTTRMEHLITDLLTYARVTSRARPFASISCDAVLKEALSNLKASIDENYATVMIGELPTVHGDRTQLVQLFQNLIDNAIKYRSGASPEIRIAAAAGEGPGPGREWLFSVTDNGIGIDRRYFPEIFKLFQRIPSEKKNLPGTGIGLAICEKIVARHGGRIWVESEPGRGATFSFTLRSGEII